MGQIAQASGLPKVGDLLDGRYRVEQLLGEGGMGAVYAATDATLNEKVAVKVMLPALRDHASWSRRFIREARAARAIRNAHVAEVLNVGELPQGTPYMVLELLVGRALDEVIRERAPLPLAEAVDYLLQACEAVAHAHVLGIVHRDLKPANLFLARSAAGTTAVKVLDFGIAKADVTVDPRTCNVQLTQTGHNLGTPAYMSPEQLRRPSDVDGRTDIWSLGLILHKMLAGVPAFEAESLLEHVGMIMHDPPTPLRARRPEAPAGLEAVVLRCLQREPADRFETVAELAAALLPFAPPGAEERVRRISAVAGRPEQAASTKPLGADDPPQAVTEPWPPQSESSRGPTLATSSNVERTIRQSPRLRASDQPDGSTKASASPVAPTISDPPPEPLHSPSAPLAATTPAAPLLPRTISQQPPPAAVPPVHTDGLLGGLRRAPWLIAVGAAISLAALVGLVLLGAGVLDREEQPASKRSKSAKAAKAPANAVSPATTTTEPTSGSAKPALGPPAGMVTVPAGAFIMGSDEGGHAEGPRHTETVDGFYIDKTEVTVAAYRACVDAGACSADRLDGKLCNWGRSGRDDHPIDCVSWAEAQSYCQWAGKQLPTEVQWEKAARGTDGRKYPWGNSMVPCRQSDPKSDYGCDDYALTTHPVGLKPEHASPYGVLDMGGNVREWVADWYDIYVYYPGRSRNSVRVEPNAKRCVRGGDRHNSRSVWTRSNLPPDVRDWRTGFRCAKPLK